MGTRIPKRARSTKGKRIPSTLFVGRTKDDDAFTACFRVGRVMGTRDSRELVCAEGQNVRVAVSKVLKAASDKVAGRRGVYRGKR